MRWIWRSIFGVAGLAVVLLLVLALVRIPIDLQARKGFFEDLAAATLNRPVAIDGRIRVTTSLWPVFIIEGVRLGNPEGFASGDFARLKSVRLQVGALPLLSGKIHVKDFSVEGLRLALEEDQGGAVNWVSTDPVSRAEQQADAEEPEAQGEPTPISADVFTADTIELTDIFVSYIGPDTNEPFNIAIDKATGSARAGEPLALDLLGSIKEEPFDTVIRAASLRELIEHHRSWMDIKTRIAGATLDLKGDVNLAVMLRSATLQATADGENLEKFSRLTGLDLPPVPRYGANAVLVVEKGLWTLNDLKAYVGNSELHGMVKVDKSGSKPRIDAEFQSSLLNLDDFDFAGWSLGLETAATPQDAAQQPDNEATGESTGEFVAKILSPGILTRFDARLQLTAEQVVSEQDQLGDGQLVLQLEDGRISVDPLKLQTPGGSLFISLSLKPGSENSDAHLRVLVENLDIGALARRLDPDTALGSNINVDIDLTTAANDLHELLAHGNGYFDFSAHPENLRAGIIDMWAVNLIAAIATETDENQSQIRCLMGRWSMQNGILKPDIVVLDTSRMRICVAGNVDFSSRRFDLTARPTAKRSEFFSLATPVGVQGSFSDFDMGAVPGGIAGTALKFVTSPLHVPLRRLFKGTLPEDGSDICGMPLGPERPTSSAPGCPRF